jgi:hypothetical protein
MLLKSFSFLECFQAIKYIIDAFKGCSLKYKASDFG